MKNNKNNKIKASIIIRTKNEERWIDICLKKVFEQTGLIFEVIIIDNNSTDSTIKKAKEYPVRIFKIKKFFPGKALNLGCSKAKGEYLVFLSAHCIPENKKWLKKLIANLRNKKVAGVYGRQKPLSYSSSFDKRDLINLFGKDKKIQVKDSFFHNANSAISRKIWKKIKFNEKTPHIEDRIWGHEIIKKGFKIIYDPNASVFHWHGINQDMNKERSDKIVDILENLDNDYKNLFNDEEKNLKIIAIVPQRDKALLVNNQPLLKLTIENLKKCKKINRIFLITDEKSNKKIAINCGAEVPFIRPKSLSEPHISTMSIVKYALEKLEKRNIFPDLIIVATENFPLRPKNIFDKMIKKIISENKDAIICVKDENGSILSEKNHRLNLITNGIIPKKLKEEKIYINRIGFGCILRPKVINSNNLFSEKIGIIRIKNSISFTEFEKSNVNIIKKNALISN
jgi:glycosyltransferase involved in cell wall biosynthesis